MSFIDGKTYKSLKRHISSNGMSVPEYLETFGLSADYPMVSNDYSLRRSLLAKAAGLGVKTGRAQQVFPQERPETSSSVAEQDDALSEPLSRLPERASPVVNAPKKPSKAKVSRAGASEPESAVSPAEKTLSPGRASPKRKTIV